MTELLDRLNNEEKPAAEEEKTPGSFGELMDTESQVRRNTADMPPSDRAWFENKLKEIDSTYKGREEKIERKQAIETIGHAMAQFFAAREGSKRGIDMSGLKFHKTDWDKKLDRLLAKQKEEIGAATKMFAEHSKSGRMTSTGSTTRKHYVTDRYTEIDGKMLPVSYDRVNNVYRVAGSEQIVEAKDTVLQQKLRGTGKRYTDRNTGKVMLETKQGPKPLSDLVDSPVNTLAELDDLDSKTAKRLDIDTKDYQKEVILGEHSLTANHLELVKIVGLLNDPDGTAKIVRTFMTKGFTNEKGNTAGHDKEGTDAAVSLMMRLRAQVSEWKNGSPSPPQIVILKNWLELANKNLQSRQATIHAALTSRYKKIGYIGDDLINESFGFKPIGELEPAEAKKPAPVTAEDIEKMTLKEKKARLKELKAKRGK